MKPTIDRIGGVVIELPHGEGVSKPDHDRAIRVAHFYGGADDGVGVLSNAYLALRDEHAVALAEVKRLQTAWDSAVQQAMQNGAKVGRLRALNQRAAACIESLSMSDAAYNLVAELKEASE